MPAQIGGLGPCESMHRRLQQPGRRPAHRAHPRPAFVSLCSGTAEKIDPALRDGIDRESTRAFAAVDHERLVEPRLCPEPRDRTERIVGRADLDVVELRTAQVPEHRFRPEQRGHAGQPRVDELARRLGECVVACQVTGGEDEVDVAVIVPGDAVGAFTTADAEPDAEPEQGCFERRCPEARIEVVLAAVESERLDSRAAFDMARQQGGLRPMRNAMSQARRGLQPVLDDAQLAQGRVRAIGSCADVEGVGPVVTDADVESADDAHLPGHRLRGEMDIVDTAPELEIGRDDPAVFIGDDARMQVIDRGMARRPAFRVEQGPPLVGVADHEVHVVRQARRHVCTCSACRRRSSSPMAAWKEASRPRIDRRHARQAPLACA